MISRRGFGNMTLAVFCLGIFATSLFVFRPLLVSDTESVRPVLFWALVSVALVLNTFYGVVLLLRRYRLTKRIIRE